MWKRTSTFPRLAVLVLTALIVSACATDDGRKLNKVYRHEVAQYAGCSNDQVAMCVDTSCEPSEFQCVERGNAAHILGVPEFPRY